MYRSISFPLFKHDYSIRMDGNYIGADMTTKQPRPGESHLRGRDLKDGKLSLRVVLGIIQDIVFCELSLGRWRRKHRKGLD